MEHANSSTAFYEELTKAISEPEPMCLVIVRVAIDENFHNTAEVAMGASQQAIEQLPEQIVHSVHQRLVKNLRQYDLLSRVELEAFVVVMKTLADEKDLSGRLHNMGKMLRKPYSINNNQIMVRIEIGSAVRQVGEKPSSLLRRADQDMNDGELASKPMSVDALPAY